MAVWDETEALLAPLLAPYKDKLCAVVLGCTHYPFAAPVIGKLLGEKTALLACTGTIVSLPRESEGMDFEGS